MKDDLIVFETFLTERWEPWQVFLHPEGTMIDGAMEIEKALVCLGSDLKRIVIFTACQESTWNGLSLQARKKPRQPQGEAHVGRSQGP